jgi:hypothetical protein
MQRQQLIDLIKSLFADILEEKFYKHNKKVQEMLESGAFVYLNSQPKAKEINTHFAGLMATTARGVYERMKEGVLSTSAKELDEIVGSLFSDEEVSQVLQFISSPVGRKLARNLDILREVFAKQFTAMNVETFKLWNEPAIAEEMDRYIKEITGEDE